LLPKTPKPHLIINFMKKVSYSHNNFKQAESAFGRKTFSLKEEKDSF